MTTLALINKIAAVQDALDAALKVTTESLEPGAYSLGWPPGGRHAKQIWLDEEARVTPAYADSTGRRRRDVVEFDVKCTHQSTGTEYKPARDGILELVAMVERAISADLTLGGVAHLVKVSAIRIDSTFSDERTRFSGATVTVSADVEVTQTA